MKKKFPYTFPMPWMGFYGCEINCCQKTDDEIWELVLEIVEKYMDGIFLPFIKEGAESYRFRFFFPGDAQFRTRAIWYQV